MSFRSFAESFDRLYSLSEASMMDGNTNVLFALFRPVRMQRQPGALYQRVKVSSKSW